MTNGTPNTPAELIFRNNSDDNPYNNNPYNTAPIRAAMDALHPDNGATPSDLQAMAERTIATLRGLYERALEADDLDEEQEDFYCLMVNSLLGAEALVERCALVGVDWKNRDHNEL